MDQFDFVVVGGGSAGSLVASRLSDSGATVCLLESGPMDRNFWIHVPGGAQNVHNNPDITWSYEAEGPQGTGRRIAARHGRVIGGSGSINGMMINRGSSADYERWTQFGNKGWRYEDVLPYFKRTERRIGQGDDRQLSMPPSKLQQFITSVRQTFERLSQTGEVPVLLTSPAIRPFVRSIIERFRPQTVVMSQNEIHAKAKIKTLAQV